MKEITYYKLEFESKYFAGIDIYNGANFESKEKGLEALKKLKNFLKENYLKRYGRKTIHGNEEPTENYSGTIYHRWVIIDENNWSDIIYICIRKQKLYLR